MVLRYSYLRVLQIATRHRLFPAQEKTNTEATKTYFDLLTRHYALTLCLFSATMWA